MTLSCKHNTDHGNDRKHSTRNAEQRGGDACHIPRNYTNGIRISPRIRITHRAVFSLPFLHENVECREFQRHVNAMTHSRGTVSSLASSSDPGSTSIEAPTQEFPATRSSEFLKLQRPRRELLREQRAHHVPFPSLSSIAPVSWSPFPRNVIFTPRDEPENFSRPLCHPQPFSPDG